MEYQALAIGLPDNLFSGIQPLLSSYMRLISSQTVKDAARLLEEHQFHLLLVDIEYLRSVHRSDWLAGIRRITFVPVIVLSDTPEIDCHLMVQLGADICTSSKHPHSMIADLARAQLRRYTEYNHYISLLETYSKRERQIDLLHYEIRHTARVSSEEMIDGMSLGHGDGMGGGKGHISNKTMYIALNYQEKMEQMNEESANEIAECLLKLETEQNRLRHYVSLLEKREAEVLRSFYFEGYSWEETANRVGVVLRSAYKIKNKAINHLAELYAFKTSLG